MSTVDKLDTAIKAVCPIHGVSIGRKDDRQTWRIDFKDEATDEQKTAAQVVVEAFVTDPVKDGAVAAIAGMESATPFTHRALREFFIGFGAVNAAFQTTLLYQRAKAVDDAIKIERAKL